MSCRLIRGDALQILPRLPANSFDLILADPPYFKVKDEAWDRQWDSEAAFLRWLRRVRDEWHRLLKPNGSLYCFASPRKAARVETLIAGRFNVLNRITWRKDAGWARKQHKEQMRAFWPASEAIIFAEHYGADNIAKGEAGYAAKCDELRGFVFEPIRLYLRGEFDRAGVHTERANVYCGTASMAARHYFTRSQWCLPTDEHYRALRRGLNREGRRPAPPYKDFHAAPRSRFEPGRLRPGEYLRADYEYLRADYEDLRADYEDLRRPFSVSREVPYTDVWDFPTVAHYPGKHPCEKPAALLEHAIAVSTRPGAAVLDCFMGKGSTALACKRLGRNFVGIEQSAGYVEDARRRLRAARKVG